MIFFLSLKNKSISDDEYDAIKMVWDEKQMHTLFDLLKWYSLLDVWPFLEAVLVYLDLYKQRNLDIFKMAITLAGISIHWAFEMLDEQKKSSFICAKRR